VHDFAWFEGFGGEEAAAGAFDFGFSYLEVHLFFFAFAFRSLFYFGWTVLESVCGLRFEIVILGVCLQGLSEALNCFRGPSSLFLFTNTNPPYHSLCIPYVLVAV
jgi:hypothetical protein